MAAIAIRKNAYDNASAGQKSVLRLVLQKLELGTPAVYENGSGVQFYVFDDSRITLNDVKWVGWIVRVLANIEDVEAVEVRDIPLTETVQVQVPERVWQEIPVLDENGDPTGDTTFGWVETGNLIWVDLEQPLGDPYDLVLSAQGAPNVVAAAERVPQSWTAVE